MDNQENCGCGYGEGLYKDDKNTQICHLVHTCPSYESQTLLQSNSQHTLHLGVYVSSLLLSPLVDSEYMVMTSQSTTHSVYVH